MLNYDDFQAIRYEANKDGFSILIEIKKKNLKVWFDVWLDSDSNVEFDWNKYIFFTNNSLDRKINKFQKSDWHFECAMTCARDFLTYNDFLIIDENDGDKGTFNKDKIKFGTYDIIS